MATTRIKIKSGSGKPTTTQVVKGELAWDETANNLYIGDTGNIDDLVTPSRQVELDGTQIISGVKSIGTASLKITNSSSAANGQVLTCTDTDGSLNWVSAAGLTITGVVADDTTEVNDAADAVVAFNINPTLTTVVAGELLIWTWPHTDGTAYVYTGGSGEFGLTGAETAPGGTMTPLGSATAFADKAQVEDRNPATTKSNLAIAPNNYSLDQLGTVGILGDLSVSGDSGVAATNTVEACNKLQAQMNAYSPTQLFKGGLAADAAIPAATYAIGDYFIFTTEDLIAGAGGRALTPAGDAIPFSSPAAVYPEPMDIFAGDWLMATAAGDQNNAAWSVLRYAFTRQTATMVDFVPTVNDPDTNFNTADTNVQLGMDQLDTVLFNNEAVTTTSAADIVTINTVTIPALIGNDTGDSATATGSTVAYIDGGTY